MEPILPRIDRQGAETSNPRARLVIRWFGRGRTLRTVGQASRAIDPPAPDLPGGLGTLGTGWGVTFRAADTSGSERIPALDMQATAEVPPTRKAFAGERCRRDRGGVANWCSPHGFIPKH